MHHKSLLTNRQNTMNNHKQIAIIRVRGLVRRSKDIADTLNMLKLHRKNYCVVYDHTPSIAGMVQKVKDFVTWGFIDEHTYAELKKRAEKDPRDPKKIKKFFRMNPPRKGYGREGIKKPYHQGGALGNRKEEINDLIARML